jgi:hypothetical protein
VRSGEDNEPGIRRIDAGLYFLEGGNEGGINRGDDGKKQR